MVSPEFLQVESYVQLNRLFNFRFPLPFTRGWAASPDFLIAAVREILASKKKKPVIVEAGSGVSTVVLGYLLEKFFPEGLLISLEHDYNYYEKTKRELELHGLKGVKLLYAPLVSYLIDGKEWLWYDLRELPPALGGRKIDVLLVDGPPETTQEKARYPAVPLLKDYLKEDFLLLLDDSKREGEKRAVEKWKREVEVYRCEELPTEKGTLIFRAIPLKKRPFFSVCIPTYNRANYLKEAIESVLSQTYPDFEVVVYDDGSTDSTEEVVRKFKDERVRYFKGEENKGRPYARNRCIELARGEWIVWLDDDDVFKPELLTAFAVEIDKFPEVSVFYPLKVLLFEESKDSLKQVFITDFYRNRTRLIRCIIRKSPISNCASCLKREIFGKFGGYDSNFPRAQDYEFWSRTLPFLEIKGVDVEGFVYRVHDNNISVNFLKMDLSYESVIKRKFLEKFSLSEIYSYGKSKEVEFLVKDLLLHEDYFNALYYSWLFEEKELYDRLLSESGISLKGKRKRLEKKFFNFLGSSNYTSAFKLAEKLGKFHYYLAYSFINKKLSFSLLKRAALINPLFDFSRFIGEDFLREINEVKERVLSKLNKYEEKKDCFVNTLREGE